MLKSPLQCGSGLAQAVRGSRSFSSFGGAGATCLSCRSPSLLNYFTGAVHSTDRGHGYGWLETGARSFEIGGNLSKGHPPSCVRGLPIGEGTALLASGPFFFLEGSSFTWPPQPLTGGADNQTAIDN